jgi:hypothetical protein
MLMARYNSRIHMQLDMYCLMSSPARSLLVAAFWWTLVCQLSCSRPSSVNDVPTAAQPMVECTQFPADRVDTRIVAAEETLRQFLQFSQNNNTNILELVHPGLARMDAAQHGYIFRSVEEFFVLTRLLQLDALAWTWYERQGDPFELSIGSSCFVWPDSTKPMHMSGGDMAIVAVADGSPHYRIQLEFREWQGAWRLADVITVCPREDRLLSQTTSRGASRSQVSLDVFFQGLAVQRIGTTIPSQQEVSATGTAELEVLTDLTNRLEALHPGASFDRLGIASVTYNGGLLVVGQICNHAGGDVSDAVLESASNVLLTHAQNYADVFDGVIAVPCVSALFSAHDVAQLGLGNLSRFSELSAP